VDDAGLNCTCVGVLECRALDADASGPLQSVTVAAMAQRIPTASARPGCFFTGTILP